MSEVTKTMTFVGTAVVVLVVAWFTRPSTATFDTGELVGEVIYNFDPLAARRLSVVTFNSLTGEPQEFEVARVGDTWSIPSKDGYPADAENQMAEAAGAVDGKEVLFVASESARDHQLYGVLDPTDTGRSIGDAGVGTRVTIEDESGKTLADLIVGNEVKDAPEQRYIRQAGRDIVLVATIDPGKLSTSFSDWIEKDLLKLNPWDIKSVQIKDYAAEIVPVLQGGVLRGALQETPRADMVLAYDDSASKWSAEKLLVFDPQKEGYVPQELAENEELDSTTLNDLKTALDDLRIVDVERKPEGLSEDLKASEQFLNSKEALSSLQSYGFVPMPAEQGFELVSTDGEVIVTLKNGVEYVLRFGDVQLDDGGDANSSASDSGTETAEDGNNLNRYIFVVARFNEGSVEKPATEALPPLPEGVSEQEVGDAATGEEAGGDIADDAADDAEGTSGENATESDETAAASTPDDGEDSEAEKILAERKRIEEANQRKLDEYADKIKEGQQQVQELNDRFGDWYYVIDNAEYKRIHLGYDQIVKEKEAEGEAAGGETPGDAADTAVDAGGFGKPGESVPGLPNIPGLLEEDTAAPPADEQPTDTAPADQPAPAAADGEATDTTQEGNEPVGESESE